MRQHTAAELSDVAGTLRAWEVVPAGTESYRTAEVSVSGVDPATSRPGRCSPARAQGVYFIGEVLDVTGHLGGFDFQWAWASGYAAAQVV